MKLSKWMLAFMLTLVPSLAAAQLAGGQRIVAQVPFEFVMGDRVVPPGEYSVQSATMNGLTLSIRNWDAKVNLFSANSTDEVSAPADHYALVFKKYGDQHFLWAVKIKGSRVICKLPESRAEKELRARNVSSTEEILYASLQ